MMKKLLFTLTMLCCVSAFSLSAQTQAALDLAGFIGEPPGELSLWIERTPEQASPMDLAVTTTLRSVGTLHAETTGPLYEVSLQSQNGFELVHTADSSYKVAYTFDIDAPYSQIAEASYNNGWPGTDSFVFDSWADEDREYNMLVSFTGVDPASYQAGSYTDTITFTIIAL